MQFLVSAAVAATMMLGAIAPGASAPSPPAAFVQQEIPATPIDLNQASLETLQEVPGIGPAMAERILEWRRENGPFEKVEDLLNIRGIGEKTLEKLRPHVKVDDGSAPGGW
ncbi:MAG: hypothetical protein GKS06_07050 [Acidobacteria bacterium]|nr:hypothetical protein [Acidobacteriota bacterium]